MRASNRYVGDNKDLLVVADTDGISFIVLVVDCDTCKGTDEACSNCRGAGKVTYSAYMHLTKREYNA